MNPTRFRLVSLLLPALIMTAGCAGSAVGSADVYSATIERTSFGIPHITADDWGSLGFGEGYAMGEDHFCSVMDQVIRVRSQRARYFGAGHSDRHVASDLALAALDVRAKGADDLEAYPEDARAWLEGYAAGLSDFLAETGVDALPGWCRGEPWVGPIAAEDITAHGRALFMIAPFFAGGIAAAEPPREGVAALHGGEVPVIEGASNGWGIGRDRSETGRGMLLANPHYPWVGSNRFWEKHLTIRGVIDVYGAGLLGVPGVAIGFNNAVGWTHTVSSGVRYTLYRLDLVAGDPTRYVVDGEERGMSSRQITIEVRGEDGVTESTTRTVWSSHHGPIVALRGFEWTPEHAFALRDANADNQEATLQWMDMGRAASMDEFQEAHARWSGMPWVNTISAGADGRAWYADVSSTPNLSPEAFAAWREQARNDPQIGRALAGDTILLDGSDSRFEWADDPAARDPGVMPFSELPQLERRDYVFNANDSYWLANSDELLTGFRGLHGLQEGTPRSPRTRMNDIVLGDRAPGGPAGQDALFTLEELAAAAFVNRSLTAELLRDAVVERCRARPRVMLDGIGVDLAAACDTLEAWDGRLDLDSRGAVLWREFVTRFERSDLLGAGSLFAVDFDPADPVGTPRELSAVDGAVLANLAGAVKVVESAGFAVDIPLGELQHSSRNGDRIPIHGGQGFWEGVTNFTRYGGNSTTLEPDSPVSARVDGSRWLRHDGYPINSGTSFIMVLEFTDDGPRAMALLTYGQSGDPDSPHYTDQTWRFSAKQWRPVAFTRTEIEADAKLRSYEVSASR